MTIRRPRVHVVGDLCRGPGPVPHCTTTRRPVAVTCARVMAVLPIWGAQIFLGSLVMHGYIFVPVAWTTAPF